MSADKIAETLAQRIKELRTERGLSLLEVANRSGMSKSNVWMLETGSSRKGHPRNPTIEAVVRLATCFGVTIEYLIGLSEASQLPACNNKRCELHAKLTRYCERPAR